MKRPPIVVVVGHVDHGKTTLLDYIRKTNVAGREAGAITQSIGAYEIVHNGKKVTFLDTPGHEAFSKMRVEGVRVADLAILVVAADEGVKPQTKDALKHVLDTKTPYVVAINKIDKPGANVEKVKQELAQAGVYLEGFGGNVSWQAISAKTGAHVEELLDLVLLSAEFLDLEYDSSSPASGVVITSELDSRRGIVVGVIIKNGLLKRGQEIFTPSAKCKVKFLEDFRGRGVEALEPSAPARILGFSSLPKIGEEFSADANMVKKTQGEVKTSEGAELPEGTIKLLLRANEAGSLSALENVVAGLEAPKPIAIVEKGLGDIHETDVKFAITSGAAIVGFKVKTDKAAENLSRAQGVKIIMSDVVYELEKGLKDFISQIRPTGARAIEVLAVFGEKDGKQIVGGKITGGSVKNQEDFKIAEGEKIIGDGKIVNLQQMRKDVAEAPEGTEAGLLVDSGTKIKPGHKLLF